MNACATAPEPAFRPGAVGLTIAGEPGLEAWRAVGGSFKRASGSLLWCVGDWLNYAESHWGDVYADAHDLTGLDHQTLKNARSVAKKYPPYRRRYGPEVGFAHYQAVMALAAADADALLVRAQTENLTVRALRDLARTARPASAAPSDDPRAEHIADTLRATERLRDPVAELLGAAGEGHLTWLIEHLTDLAARSVVAEPDAATPDEIGAPGHRLRLAQEA